MGSKQVVEADVVIVGASTAGLAVSMFLAEKDIDYVCIDKNSDISVKTHCGYSWDTFTKKYNFSKEIWIQHYDRLHLHFPNVTLKTVIPSELRKSIGYLDRRQLYLEMYKRANVSNNFIFDEEVTNIVRNQENEIIYIESDESTYEGKIYVDCTGSRGLLVKDYLGDSTVIGATGLERIYNRRRNEHSDAQVLEMFLGEVCSGGYGWIAPIGDQINVGVGKFLGVGGPSLISSIDSLLDKRFANKDSIQELESQEASLLPVNLLNHFSYKNTIGVGDSVGQVNPLVGEGVRFILSSADLASIYIEKALSRGSKRCLSEYEKDWYKKYREYYKLSKLLQKIAKRAKFKSYWKTLLIYRILKYNNPEDLAQFFKGHVTIYLLFKISLKTILSIIIPENFLKPCVEVSLEKP